MELRQLRYFVRTVDCGSMGRAAQELGVVTSALSQQISRLEAELSTRLLQRKGTGVVPTEAGIAFLQQAQLTLRHADQAVQAAQAQRLSGQVSVGLAPSTASVLGLPLLQAMRQRYPEVRLHLVEAMSGHLNTMLNARTLDLAVVFATDTARRWSVQPLLREGLFLLARRDLPGLPPPPRRGRGLRLSGLGALPLILPSGPHGLRHTVDTAFAAARVQPQVVAEIDSLTLVLKAVRAGLGASIQPGAVAPVDDTDLLALPLADAAAARDNLLASVSDDELSPAALATRVVMADLARGLVAQGRWRGAVAL